MRRLRSFLSDRRGVSAVEFALIAPLMILLYLGTAEAALVLMMDRKVTNAASTIGDLVTRVPCISGQDEIDGIFDAAEAVMAPYSTGPLKMRISVVELTAPAPNKEYELDWEAVSDADTMPAATGTPEIPDDLLTNVGSAVVMAQAEYEYDPPFGEVFEDAVVLRAKLYFSPRQSIDLPDSCS